MKTHAIYMHRCIELARMGAGRVAPNPLVGAVLVYNDHIIGEGYHRQYGQAHAEVNCINAVAEADQSLVPLSTLYVSLEPCAHFGKTPPCADLIIARKIPRVVIGCRDPFKEVDGKGIEKLIAAGIEVIQPVLEAESVALNKRFFTFHTKYRPYIILKWAQTANGIIGNTDHSRLLISNEFSKRLVHRWRSEETAILVGTNTALYDNPSLTNRDWSGPQPVRLVLDMDLRLPVNLHLFDGTVETIVLNGRQEDRRGKLQYYRLKKDSPVIEQICGALYEMNIQSVLVEGGTTLLQSFIDAQCYDEARIITNTGLLTTNGLPAPVADNLLLQQKLQLQSDSIQFYTPGN